MTTQHPTQPGWLPQPPPDQPPTPPPPMRGNGRKVLLIIGGIVVTLFIIGSLFAPDPTPTAPVAPAAKARPAATAPAETSPPAPRYATPALADFKLTVKELTRQRFGSAGDLVDYRVQLTQVRDRNYDPSKSYELTYRISGGEDGTETQTMMIQGDEYEQYEGHASTRGGVKITAKAISIEEV